MVKVMSADYPVELNKQVIDSYRTIHNIDATISDNEIISIMIKNGDEKLLQTKFDKIENDLLFGFGFVDNSIDNLQISHKYLSPENATIDNSCNEVLTHAEENEIMEFAKTYLTDSIESSIATYDKYYSEIGYLSYSAIWHGLKNFVNLFDYSKDKRTITTLNEKYRDLNKQYKDIKYITGATTPAHFGFRFEEIRGVEYNPHYMKKFAQDSEKYMNIIAHKVKYERLSQGIAELKEIYQKEVQLDRLRSMGQNIPAQANPEISYDEKFVQIIDEYCEGDENLKAFYINFVSEGMELKSELEKKGHFLEAIKNLEQLTKELYESKLAGKSFEYYEREQEKGFLKTFGGVNPKEETAAWVMKQKQGEGFTKMGLIIATTVMTGGSNFVANVGENLAGKVGVTAAGNIIKAGMTLEGVAVGTALDYMNALTSESGLTKEKNQEILQNTARMIPYAFFGAYISGPTGDMIVKSLQGSFGATVSNMTLALSNTVASGAGFTTEIALDTLFESVISDGDIMAVIKGNASGEAQSRAMNALIGMVVGGRANVATKDILKSVEMEDYKIKVEESNSGIKYTLIAPDGAELLINKPEEIIAGVIGKYVEDGKPLTLEAPKKAFLDTDNLKLADNQNLELRAPFLQATEIDLLEKIKKELSTAEFEYNGKKYKKYNTAQVNDLMLVAEKNPELFDFLYSETIKSEGGTIFRFDTDDIIELMSMSEKYPELLNNIVRQKNCNYWDENPRFNFDEITTLMSLAENIPQDKLDILNTLINAGNIIGKEFYGLFNANDIKNLMNIEKENPALFKTLIERKKLINKNNIHVFNAQGIIDVMNIYKSEPEKIDYLLNAKDADGNYLFSTDIGSIIDSGAKLDLIKSVVEAKILEDGKLVQRFNDEERMVLIRAGVSDEFGTFDKLINYEYNCKHENKKGLLGAHEINDLLIAQSNNFELYEKLFNYKITDENGVTHHRFSPHEISFLTRVHDLKNLENFLDIKDKSNQYFLYDAEIINKIFQLKNFGKENTALIMKNFSPEIKSETDLKIFQNSMIEFLNNIDYNNNSAKFEEIKPYIEKGYPFGIASKLVESQGLTDAKSNYIKNIDYEKLFEIAPSTRFFTSNDFIEFINYHYNNGTKDFTSENLVYPVDNLQKLLSEKLISYTELNKILSSFPNTNRNIGTLPKDWGLSDDISKQDKIFDLINKYTQDNSIEDLQQGLVSILDKNVKIQYLGRGAYGKVLKIEIDNAEPVVLKTFFVSPEKNSSSNIHGAGIEPQAGYFAKANNISNFAEFYCGKLANSNDTDAFMITKFIGENDKLTSVHDVLELNYMYTSDDHGGNLTNGITLDYGAVKIFRDINIEHYNLAINILDNVLKYENGQIVQVQDVNTYLNKLELTPEISKNDIEIAVAYIKSKCSYQLPENTINPLINWLNIK